MQSTKSGVTTDTGAFAIVPEWLLDADVSDRAIRLYAVLGRYADRDGKSFPSRKTLAAKLRCSTDTVDRALRELADAGALKVEAQYAEEGDRTTNLYTVLRVQGGTRTDAATGRRTDAAQNESQDEREGSSTTSVVDSRRAAVEAGGYDPHHGMKIEGRNLPWDALVEATEADERVEAGRIAAALKRIRRVVADDLSLGDNPELDEVAIASEIWERARLYRERWPNVDLTPSALAANWSRVATTQPGSGRAAVDVAEAAVRRARGEA